jgi:SAM-dependent methyltransferase
MEKTLSLKKNNTDYEASYHEVRHNNHFKDDYYDARARIAITKFFSSVQPGERILDFGCGLGQNIFHMNNAVGYDVSSFGIEFCKKKGVQATTNLNDIENNAFDVVFSAHVLEHHPHPKTMLEDIHKKLKPGKRLILVIPYEKHGKASFELDLNQHLYTWNFQTINNLLNITGYKILENKYVHGAGYNKLLPVAKFNFGLYRWLTNTISRIAGIREMMIVAEKK